MTIRHKKGEGGQKSENVEKELFTGVFVIGLITSHRLPTMDEGDDDWGGSGGSWSSNPPSRPRHHRSKEGGRMTRRANHKRRGRLLNCSSGKLKKRGEEAEMKTRGSTGRLSGKDTYRSLGLSD